MSHPWNHFSPFADATHRLLGILAMGLDGEGSYTITASRHGLTLKFGKLKVAQGKDARELFQKFDVLMAKVKAAKNRDALAAKSTSPR